MSRVAKAPIALPAGVQVSVNAGVVTVKGGKSSLDFKLAHGISVEVSDTEVRVSAAAIAASKPLAGTTRAVIANMVAGVTKGFEIKLTLVGVGYRAAVVNGKVNLSAGFSHPVEYPVPVGISVETPIPTEIVIKGADKHMVGQVAADIRAFRPPEPYKGKGVRYSTEKVVMKEAKKK